MMIMIGRRRYDILGDGRFKGRTDRSAVNNG